jgi:hypothetical protein
MVSSVSSTEGLPFSGTVATFTNADQPGSSYTASIVWGDGSSNSQTTPVATKSGFSVAGMHTYLVPGTYPITVTITSDQPGSAIGQGQATVNALALQATGTTVTPVAGQSFTGVVASFTDGYPSLSPSDYVATIAWGDGHDSTATITANALGGFNVIGTNTYASQGTKTITVTVVRSRDNQTATAASKAIVALAAQTTFGTSLTGELDPASNTGTSSTAAITTINQPTLVGTATPYAIVTVLARRSDQAQPVALGQAITDASGLWSLIVGPLPDGSYTLSASQTVPAGQPTPAVALTPGSQLTIDTVPPRVLSARYKAASGRVALVLEDTLSGFNTASVTNPVNYALVGAGPLRRYPSQVTILPNASVRPSNPITVSLEFKGLAGTFKGRHVWKLLLGKITDLAGNPVSNRSVTLSAGRG